MDIRESIKIIEGRKHGERVMVEGRQIFIDGVNIGEIRGGRFLHKGQLTPSSGYYLKLSEGTQLYRRPSSNESPMAGEFAYADDLIQHIAFNADELLAKVQDAE